MKKLLTVLLFTTLCLVAKADLHLAQEHLDRAQMLFDAKNYASVFNEVRMARRVTISALEYDRVASRADYIEIMTTCQIAPGDVEAMANSFLKSYPYSKYTNDVIFALSSSLYEQGKYAQALSEWLGVDVSRLDENNGQSYYFKVGHSYVVMGDYAKARPYLQRVESGNIFSAPAQYYIAYSDYVCRELDRAKSEFAALSSTPAYSNIVPFYIFHIEYLQGNYKYVVDNGEALLSSATASRAVEITKIIAQAWFHLEDYGKALDYMGAYAKLGGTFARGEEYLVGYSQYMVHDYAKAAQSLVRVCGADDVMTQNASYVLGDCYLRLGQKQDAMRSFHIASSSDFNPTTAQDALLNYCKLQYELGEGVFNEAVNAMNRYLEIYPSSPKSAEVKEFLASALYNSRNYEAAYNTIIQIKNPNNNIKSALQKILYFRALELMSQDKNDEAAKMLLQVEKLGYSPKFTALSKFWLGEISYKAERYNEALTRYHQYYRLAPEGEKERIMASYSMGYSYFNLDQRDKSREWFNDFISFYPSSDGYKADAYNRLGDILYSEREFWKAADMYDKAISLNTEQRHYGTYRRAFVWGLVDRTPRKIESLRDIIARQEGEYVDAATYELGRTLMGLDRFEEASKVLQDYVKRYPNSKDYIRALSDLGLISQNLGHRNEALAYYKKVVQSAPSASSAKDAMQGIRSIYVDINDVDSYFNYAKSAGVELSESAIERDSLSFSAAEKVFAGSDSKRAVEAMRGYLKSYPTGNFKANATYMLGVSQLRSGDSAGAGQTLEIFTTLYTNDFTERALTELSKIYAQERRWDDASRVYLRLAQSCAKSDDAQQALSNYLISAQRTGDSEKILAASEKIEQEYSGHKDVFEQALFAKAQVVGGERASKIYLTLSADPSTPHGAQSAYRVAQELFDAGKYADAQKVAIAMGKSNTPQTYWLGMAYLVLGDTYAKKGDSFQARATYQSIVEGYSPVDDGIVDQARERIKNLK